jgi:hypothetical protein
MARLSGSTHAVAVACMLESNCGLSRGEARRRTEEYLENLDRICDENAALRAARDSPPRDDDPPF